MADIPPSLLHAELLAEEIYSCWRELMVTDKVFRNAAPWPEWKGMSEDWRRTLIESVKMTCTATLRKVQEKIESERAGTGTTAEAKVRLAQIKRRTTTTATTKQCYICEGPCSLDGSPPICERCQ